MKGAVVPTVDALAVPNVMQREPSGADIAPAGPLMLVADNDGGRGAA